MEEPQLMTERFYSAFRQVQYLLRQQLQPHLNYNGLQLTRGQFYLLSHLFRRGPLMITELSEWMNVRPATMSPIVDRLEKHLLVTRNKDSKDRRIVYVGLTPNGKSLVQEMEVEWRQMLSEHLSRLTEQEQELVITLLEKFARES
ncbi:MarR family winged helix-turn-helix transcriptional regulator [Paenibacillus thalictri]|nr:MarR family transcriptional regulator [Paenibacillus thalictri]